MVVTRKHCITPARPQITQASQIGGTSAVRASTAAPAPANGSNNWPCRRAGTYLMNSHAPDRNAQGLRRGQQPGRDRAMAVFSRVGDRQPLGRDEEQQARPQPATTSRGGFCSPAPA